MGKFALNSERSYEELKVITDAYYSDKASSLAGIVVGVRCVEKSGRLTEDHFLFRPNTNLYKCKGKELAQICQEYVGAHELQLQIITH